MPCDDRAMTTEARRTGLFIIRAWCDGDPPSMRVRMTVTEDIAGREVVCAASSLREVLDQVAAWLSTFEGRDARPGRSA